MKSNSNTDNRIYAGAKHSAGSATRRVAGTGRAARRLLSAVLIGVMAVTGVFTYGLDNEAFAFATFTGKSPFSGVAYNTYYHNKDKFSGNLVVNGVDVSEYQSSAKSNYVTAWNNGVEFAIMRVTWTGYGSAGSKHNDVNFEQHYKKAKNAGLLTGVYVFSQACSVSEAKAEATYAINRLRNLGIKPGDLDLPVYMDYEFAGPSNEGRMYIAKKKGNLTKAKATSYAKAFCETIKAAGYTPGIYASTSFLWNTIDGATLGKSYEIWDAQYYNKSEYETAYSKWQYSSAARIPGICNSSGNKMNTDVNFWYLKKNRTVADKSIKDIANCAITGPSEVTYTGNKVRPVFTVKFNGTKLTKGTHYTVGYLRNKKLGTGYAYIRGIGDYTGYKLVSFSIVDTPSEIIEDVDELQPITELVDLKENAAKAGYTLTDTLLSGVIAGNTAAGAKLCVSLREDYSDYKVKIIKTSTGAVLADSTKVINGNSLVIVDPEGKKVAQVRIKLNGVATIKFDCATWVYTGKARKPAVTVKFGDLEAGTRMYSGSYFCSVVYPKDVVMPGMHTVTVKGKGIFQGSYTRDYKIQIRATKMKSLKATAKAGFISGWEERAASRISGYQLQYSRHEDMSLDLKDLITKPKTTTHKVTGRYSGYKYWVRVRCYKTINGKKYFSPWSSKMTVNVK